MTTIRIKNNVRQDVEYMDWTIDAIYEAIRKLFPLANHVTVTEIEYDYIYLTVDGRKHCVSNDFKIEY